MKKNNVVVRSSQALGLSLLIDGTQDSEISINELDTGTLAQKLRDWHLRGLVTCRDADKIELSEIDDENGAVDYWIFEISLTQLSSLRRCYVSLVATPVTCP